MKNIHHLKKQLFALISLAVVLVFSWLSPAEAASALSDDSPFGPELKESKHAVSLELKKPKGMAALAWLSQLEEKRDTAELAQDYASFLEVTQEISATLAGKYGLGKRRAKPQERQRMINSIVRTRQHFAGIPDILSQLYFNHNPVGCWKKVKKDPGYAKHMGVILAVDAICYATRQQPDFAEAFVVERQAPVTSSTFIDTITNIVTVSHMGRDQKTIRKIIATLPSSVWGTLVKEAGQQLDIIAPVIDVQQIFNELMVSGDEGYQGWELHKLGALGSWIREGGESIAQAKKSVLANQPDNFMLKSLWYQGLLLDPSFKEHFQGLDDRYFTGGYLGISYSFFLPLGDGQSFCCPPLRFYLTKALPKEEEKRNLIYQKRKVSDLDQQEAFWIETTKQFQNAFSFRDHWMLSYNLANLTKSLSLFKKVADQGDKTAQHNYAFFMLREGKRGTPGLTEARHYYKMAADQGLKESQFCYALMLARGEGGLCDLPRARVYYKRAADQGHARAQNNYALMLCGGKGGGIDLREAWRYYKMAADQGLKGAQFAYAVMLTNGEGELPDLIQAKIYYKRAADQGHLEAQNNYAVMLLEGKGGGVDYREARRYFKMAADQGCEHAQGNYACMLLEGKGGGIDHREARRYFKMATDQGCQEGQYNYAVTLVNGEGGVRDLSQARVYYKMAADQGHIDAQKNYAVMLYRGEGGPPQLGEALRYCQMAAGQGLSSAQALLPTILVAIEVERARKNRRERLLWGTH